ncbi:hypothetical protein EZS27_042575, partial [termite gut metagenome]
INIVANKRSELSKRFLILLSDRCCPSRILFKSDGESEKKAISEADAKPDTNNSKPAKIPAMIAGNEGVITDIPLKISTKRHK